jgi:hypothetical protein
MKHESHHAQEMRNQTSGTGYSESLPLPSVFMPDNGCQFKPERMEEMGYTLYIDTRHKDRDYPTRWWFRGEHNRDRVIQGIKAQGFEVVTINP